MSRSASQQAPAARRATLRRVLRYIRPHMPKVLLSLALMALALDSLRETILAEPSIQEAYKTIQRKREDL